MLHWNYQQLTTNAEENDFYYDPHTANYTGMQQVLKGWCGAIKISARNLFYRLFAPSKTAYDNYRDDHGHYRELTQCDGVLRWTGTKIEVHLVPQVNYSPKLRKIIERHLVDLNTSGLTLPDGSGRPLHLRLTHQEQISVRIDDTSNSPKLI